MAEMGTWNGKKFLVSPNLIRSFSGLSIRGSSSTGEADADGETYVTRKSSKPTEISLTVELSVYTGCAVQNEALTFVGDARAGATDYFYVSGKKLVTYQLMLTDASISDVKIAPNGVWTYCKVNLTMRQASGSGGNKSASSRVGGSSASSTVKMATKSVKSSVVQGIQNVVGLIRVAQDYSAKKKQTNGGSRIMMLRD